MTEDLGVSGALNVASRGLPVRAYLDARIRALYELFEAQDSCGRVLAQRYAEVMDELLRRLFLSTLGHFRDDPSSPPVLLAAVGGYGRKLLGWKSDLDVRLVTHGAPERIQAVAEAMLYPLWDAGISIGHQVIAPAQVCRDAIHDLPTATALLDFRTIAGDASLERAVHQRAYETVFEPRRLPEFVRRLRAEQSARHLRQHDSVYLLEPDVKNGAGGLRDLDLGLWAAAARWQTADLTELQRLDVLAPREAQDIARAIEFLWAVRNRLHRASGRRSDRLTFPEQEAVARDLGYRARIGAAPNAREDQLASAMAEAFMSDYYRHARVVTRASEFLLERATPRLERRAPRQVSLGQGLCLEGAAIALARDALRTDPIAALRLYTTALARGLPVHADARDAVARECAEPNFVAALRASREAAALFVSLVCSCQRAPFRGGSVLAELHDVGLLVAMIPEFLPVVGRAHHDVYHVYTVDVHSVAAVDHLRALIRGELAALQPLATRLAQDSVDHEVLFLATLLHDIGKGVRGKDHALRGAEMARPIASRLGLRADAVEEASLLVREHLTMYLIAMRRDVEDPCTVADFAARIRSRERLKALYLLTVADLCTTSPTSMTRWKAIMLDALYQATDRYFEGEPLADPARIQRRRDEAARYWDDALDRRFLDEFLDTMPERYLLSTTPAEIAAHAKVALQVRGESVTAALVPSRHPHVAELCVVTEGKSGKDAGLCVVAGDRPGLLAGITAALAANRLDIHAAQIHSRQLADGTAQAVDLFWVRDAIDGVAGVEHVLPKLQRDLRNVIMGHVAPRELMNVRAPSRWSERPSPRVSTEVTIDQTASPQHSVIEVLTKDKAGVLFVIAQALHDLGLTIALAKISTEGTRAADVFYVVEADGGKLRSEQRVTDVRRALLSALEPPAIGREEHAP